MFAYKPQIQYRNGKENSKDQGPWAGSRDPLIYRLMMAVILTEIRPSSLLSVERDTPNHWLSLKSVLPGKASFPKIC